MKIIKYKISGHLMTMAAIMAVLFSACTPDEEDASLGPKAEAAFTVTDISTPTMRNTYLLESTTENAFLYKWDLGNGSDAISSDNKIDTAYFEDKGDYTITLTTLSEGGHSTATQSVKIGQDAVTGADAVTGGDLSDETAWTFNGTGGDKTSYTVENGTLKLSNADNSSNGIAIWQAVELKGGRAYQFSADVKGSGMTNSWLEIGLLNEAPVDGVDPSYTAGIGLNTWTGCGVEPFDGPLSDYSCLGDGKINVAEDGTYYLVIKSGSAGGTLGTDGLTIDNIQFIAQPRLLEGDNVITGSDMEDANAWNITSMGLTLTTVEFTDGVMKLSNGAGPTQTNVGVWQSVEVSANQIYKLKATVTDLGSTGSWKEFYISTTEPADGVDYTTGRIEPGSTKSWTEAGTVYVLIKSGSWDGSLGPDGVSIDDVELVEMH